MQTLASFNARFLPSGSVAFDASRSYWAGASPSQVVAVDNGGGTPRILFTDDTSAEEPSSLAVDLANVYFTTAKVPCRDHGRILKRPLAPDALAAVIADEQLAPRSLTVAGDRLFWIAAQNDSGIPGYIMTAPASGSAAAAVFYGSAGEVVQDLVAYDDILYWSIWKLKGPWSLAKILPRPTSGGAPANMLAQSDGMPMSLLVRDGIVHWSSQGTDPDGPVRWPSSVHRVPGAGGTAKTLATGQSGSTMLFVDGRARYWTTPGSSAAGYNVHAAADADVGWTRDAGASVPHRRGRRRSRKACLTSLLA